eukprot:Tamp_28279.p1 GENE.Tamp_28279~~Tamp_28279.p1  ORF type:complete len:184 (-),score=23.76 Tamp_28279:88-639(-)
MASTKPDGRWAHIACMHFVAETEAGDVCAQEPVINIKDVPDERFRMECVVCESSAGACVQCEHMTSKKLKKFSSKGKGCCNRPFHVGCAAYFKDPNKTDNARFFLDVKELPNKLVHVHCVVCYMLQYVTHCSMHHVIKSYSISHHIAFIYSISHHVAFIDSIPYRIALCIMSSSLRGVQNSLI